MNVLYTIFDSDLKSCFTEGKNKKQGRNLKRAELKNISAGDYRMRNQEAD